jgi:hypothetical protein
VISLEEMIRATYESGMRSPTKAPSTVLRRPQGYEQSAAATVQPNGPDIISFVQSLALQMLWGKAYVRAAGHGDQHGLSQ